MSQAMASDHQRVHPVDVEAPPSAPLVSHESSKSENGDPIDHYPPVHRKIPVIHSKPPKKRSCLCKCMCWTISLLLIQVIIVGALVGIFFLVFQPKLPKYSVDSLQISEFNISNDLSLYARFDVNITARNPNKKIGIYYVKGSHLSVWYIDTQLCEGSLPKFYQGHRNTTVLDISLTGQAQNGSSLLTSLSEQQKTGQIPLKLKATVPVRIKLGKLKLMKMKFRVRCNLVVNSLTENNLISVRSSKCKFRLRL